MLPESTGFATLTPARVLRSVRIASEASAREPEVVVAPEPAAAPEPVIDKAALDAAYERGRSDAAAEFAASAESAQLRAANALELLAGQLTADHRGAVDANSRAVVAAAVDVAEWVLRQPLDAHAHGLIARLTEAAETLIPTPQTVVRVSASDAAAVRRWAENLGCVVKEDPTLNPGDALLQTESGHADVSIAAALRVAADMLGVDPGRPA